MSTRPKSSFATVAKALTDVTDFKPMLTYLGLGLLRSSTTSSIWGKYWSVVWGIDKKSREEAIGRKLLSIL